MAEDKTPPSGGQTPKEETPPPSGGRTAHELRDIADALRSRVDLFGKTLAALATLGTTAVGLSKIGDLFPAEGNRGWVILACAGLVVAALAAIGVAVRLMLVARPVFIGADLEHNDELDGGERKAVRPVFEAAAKRFGYSSLIGLQERERSLRNAASRTTDEDERARRTALADEVKAEIEQALARGQVVAIRRRATRAVSDLGAWALYAAVIGGLIVFAIGTDTVSSDRKDPVAEAKACGEAREAGATAGELGRTNDVCDGEAQEDEEKPEPPSAAEARAQIAAELAATLKACTALVQNAGDAKSRPLKNGDCDPVREAVSGMDPVGGQSATAAGTACRRVSRAVIVNLNDDKHHNVIDHIFDARRAGHPRTLHIRRPEAAANRRASLRGIPTKKGFDRDEYPPAMSDEGGEGADVRYIKSAENRSAGQLMGRQLAPYCNEQRFVFEG